MFRMRKRRSSQLRHLNWRDRAIRRLFAEALEGRVLLTTITSVSPAANSFDAPQSTNITATFDLDVTAATDQTFVIHTSQRGKLAAAATTVSVDGRTATHDPTLDLLPGESVQATVTSGVSTAGGAATKHVWQFRAEAAAGSGLFVDSGQEIGNPASNISSQGVELGDLDGDGDLDAFVANNATGNRVYLNDRGVFTDAGQSLGGNMSQEVALGDLDGDGDLDAVVSNVYGQGNRVWQNNGAGVFSEAQSFGGGDSDGIQLGDLDGDGDLDAFVANDGQGNRVWRNDGGVLNDTGQDLGNHASQSVELGDVDGDGDLDAFVVNNQYQPNRVWLNDGNGAFSSNGQALGFHTSRSVDLGDVDGDGDLDAFVANRDQDNRVWLNDGSGVFVDTGQLLVRAGTGLGNRYSRTDWVEFGDLDADGDLDAFTVNDNGGPNRIWLNDGAGVFSDSGQDLWLVPGGSFLDNTPSRGVALGDADLDGDVDAFVVNDSAANGTTSVARLWINQNLQPSVSLAIDNATIAEDAGAATVTATLSAAHTVAVTVDLGFSGTATVDTDYTTSGAQIVIAAGATSGSVAITAIQDAVDDDDETVIVDITGTTNADEAGTQQVTTTIVDDDEPAPVPDVTLAVDNAAIPEEAGVATFTATLSLVTTVPVTVDLGLSGSADASDYTVSGTQIVIAPGATSGSVTVTAVQDTEDEPDETVVVDITSVTGGTESGTQQQTTTITDDDEVVVGMTVTTLTATATGFIAEFANELDAAELNLYDTQTAGLGAADVLLSGAASGPITGSLVVAARSIEFIKSGSPLAGDTYTVTLRSAADGIKDTGGLLLDGNGDGTAGDDFSSTFEVAAPAANSVTVSIPDVVRGPGQAVNLPADSTSGIPLTISEGTNVRAIDVRIAFDPTLISIEAATPGPDAPAGASVVLNNSTPGLAIVVYFASAPLPAGSGVFVNLQASVPEANASENYRRHQVLDLHDVVVSDGNDNESPTIADDGLHVATFFGDVSANGRINAADAAQVARIAALLDSGFANTPSTDPGLLGDISGNNRLNAADASLVAQFAALITVPQIPPLPGGVVISGFPSLPAAVQVDSEQDDRLVSPLALGFTDRATWMAEEIGEDVLSERADNPSSNDAFFAELMDEVVTDGLSDHLSQ